MTKQDHSQIKRPNEETIKAIEEAMSGIALEKIEDLNALMDTL